MTGSNQRAARASLGPLRFPVCACVLLLGAALALAGCDRSRPIERALGSQVGLSPGLCPIIHCNPAQTGALAVKGPELPSHRLEAEEVDHFWSSPIAGGALDFIYANGTRVYWVPQVDRILKLALDASGRLEKLAELPLQPREFPRRSPEQMRTIVEEFDATPISSERYDALAGEWLDYQLEGLRAYYAMLNDHGVLYVGTRNRIVAYADAEPGNPHSGIVEVGQFVFDKLQLQLGLKMPFAIMIGINMLPDGRPVAVTLDGTLIVVEPDMSAGHYYRLRGERIWNSLAIDERGGLYVAGSRRIHKLVWLGDRISDREQDGAWRLDYAVGALDESLRGGRGTGTTPALMGGEQDADRFVVVADAADVNRLMLLWRDEIPEGWHPPAGARSRRVAGMLPVDFGDPTLSNSYSENSAVIFDYGAVLGNNQVRTNEAMRMPVQLKMKDPARTPYGLQKFQWNRERRRFEVAWVRPDVSSPNSTPVVATRNRQLHVVGVDAGEWVMQALDWDTGETRAVYRLGRSERFNPIMLALELMPSGDPIYPSFAGVIHLRIGPGSSD